MAKYFINREIYYQGKKEPPRKTIITDMYENFSNTSYVVYDELGNDYALSPEEIFDDNDNPIKDARTRLGLTQEKFAEMFEIPKRTLEDWESGKSKPAKYVISLIIEKAFAYL